MKNIREKKHIIYSLPISLMIIVLPLIVRFSSYETGLENVAWTNTEAYANDIYLYWKSIVFTFLSITMLVLMLIDWKNVWQRILEQKFIWVLFGGYSVLTLISAFASDYPLFVWKGSTGQFESTFVLLGYIITGLYGYVYAHDQKIRRMIPGFFVAASFLMGLIGLSQFLGKDIFNIEFVQRLIMPAKVYEASGGIHFEFENNRVYLTLYNPNYAGVYCACMIVVLFAMILNEKQWKKKFIYVPSLALMIISLVGSGSKTGIVISGLMMMLIVLFHSRRLIQYWYLSIPGITAIILGTSLIFEYHSVDLVGMFLNNIQPVKAEYHLTELYTDHHGVHFCYDDTKFCISMEVTDTAIGVLAECEDGSTITITETGEASVLLEHPKLPGIPVTFMKYQGFLCMGITVDGEEWVVTNQLGTSYRYINRYGKFDTLKQPETAVLTEYPSWISGRGYIWARSIPLLKENLFLGSGPDTFIMEYPNDDYLGIHNAGTHGTYTTRPHNWYLQMGIQTGVLSLILVLICFAIYGIRGLTVCLRRAVQEELPGQDGKPAATMEVFFLGSIVFLLMGLINDSSIGVTPLFWCMYGIAISCMTLRAEDK